MIIKLLILLVLFVFLLCVVAYKKILNWLIIPLIAYIILAMILCLKPELTGYIAKIVGVGRGADLVIYLYILGTNFIVLVMFIKILKLQRNISKITMLISHASTRLREIENKK
tara:strand:- start:205 stop:543 length:339 start_codon:yes stop_codon:yes gene_type:complete